MQIVQCFRVWYDDNLDLGGQRRPTAIKYCRTLDAATEAAKGSGPYGSNAEIAKAYIVVSEAGCYEVGARIANNEVREWMEPRFISPTA
jgi:hypothetical protein